MDTIVIFFVTKASFVEKAKSKQMFFILQGHSWKRTWGWRLERVQDGSISKIFQTSPDIGVVRAPVKQMCILKGQGALWSKASHPWLCTWCWRDAVDGSILTTRSPLWAGLTSCADVYYIVDTVDVIFYYCWHCQHHLLILSRQSYKKKAIFEAILVWLIIDYPMDSVHYGSKRCQLI